MAPTRPSIMSEGAITSAPARAWLSACANQRRHGGVVDDLVALQKSVVTVAGVRIERHVRDEAHVGNRGLDLAAGAAHEIVGI